MRGKGKEIRSRKCGPVYLLQIPSEIKATGYLTFDNGQLYVKIKTKTKAEGAGVHPSVDCIMVRG